VKKGLFFGFVFAAAVAAAAVFFVKHSEEAGRYVRYDTGFLPASFDYPAGWKLTEDKGIVQKYKQAMMVGPRNEDKTFSAAFTVIVSPTKEKGGLFSSVDELKTHNLVHLFDDPRVVELSSRQVGGAPAQDVTAVFERPPFRIQGLPHKTIPVKERMLLFQKDSRLFEIRYSADQQEYPKHLKDFEHLVASIRLKSA